MAYELSVDEKDCIVKVRIYGSTPHEEHLMARKEAGRICQEKGYYKLLVDLHDLKTDKEVSTISCYQFGSTYNEEYVIANALIANILPENDKARKDVEFVSLVGKNRGVRVKNFIDMDKAMKWLLEKE